tara:strand:- start:264 stop:539 length:276 start_codon:yes stop_codon:yes gene_type:complete
VIRTPRRKTKVKKEVNNNPNKSKKLRLHTKKRRSLLPKRNLQQKLKRRNLKRQQLQVIVVQLRKNLSPKENSMVIQSKRKRNLKSLRKGWL